MSKSIENAWRGLPRISYRRFESWHYCRDPIFLFSPCRKLNVEGETDLPRNASEVRRKKGKGRGRSENGMRKVPGGSGYWTRNELQTFVGRRSRGFREVEYGVRKPTRFRAFRRSPLSLTRLGIQKKMDWARSGGRCRFAGGVASPYC